MIFPVVLILGRSSEKKCWETVPNTGIHSFMLLHLKERRQQDISRYHIPTDFQMYHKLAYVVLPGIIARVLF